jgi:amidohydrolase
MDAVKLASNHFQFTQQIRRDLHKNPELGYQEFRTASLIANHLKEYGYQVREGVGKTGVIGVMDTGCAGKSLMLRFDMDALPIQEANKCDYASQKAGVMHACGHDGHVAIGITVAKIFAENKESLHGKIKFVFQPAEEGLGGAESMLADGVLDNPKSDIALAVHMWNEKPLGWLGITPGPLMAGADIVTITITGRGGHGAIPQEAVDPVIAAAHVLIGLQTIVSRNLSPMDSAVVGITEFHAGDASNVIPSTAVLRGSIRSFSIESREMIHMRVRQISESVAAGFGCKASVEIIPLTPAVINSIKIADEVTVAAKRLLPDQRIDSSHRVMVSDDMAFFLEKIPGCYILIGSADEKNGLDGHHHSPAFNFSEKAMETAVALLVGYTEASLS